MPSSAHRYCWLPVLLHLLIVEMVVVVVLVVLIIVSQFIKCHNMAIVTTRVMFSVYYSYFEK